MNLRTFVWECQGLSLGACTKQSLCYISYNITHIHRLSKVGEGVQDFGNGTGVAKV